MKACFLRAAGRPTGTLDAALIFILRTSDRGADSVAHTETSMGQHIYFLSVFLRWKYIQMYSPLYPSLWLKAASTIKSELLRHKQNLIINQAETWDKKAWSNQLWCLARSMLLSTFKISHRGHLCLPAGKLRIYTPTSMDSVNNIWLCANFFTTFTHVWNIVHIYWHDTKRRSLCIIIFLDLVMCVEAAQVGK